MKDQAKTKAQLIEELQQLRRRMEALESAQVPPASRNNLAEEADRAAIERRLIEHTAQLIEANQQLQREVADRRKAEEELRASEEKMRAICTCALDAVIVMDAGGKVTHWNPAAERMFGYSFQEAYGRQVHELLVPSDSRQSIVKGLADFATTGNGAVVGNVVEQRALRKDGSQFPAELSVSAMQVQGQWWATAFVRDVAARKQAAEAVQQERRMLKKLLEVYEAHRQLVTYEIHDGVSQPLAASMMTLEGILRSLDRHSPEVAKDGFGEVLRLLRGVLDETRRIMSGLRPTILDDFGVIAAVDHLVGESQSGAGLRVEWSHSEQFDRLAPPLETALYRIVQEGLANALRHAQTDRVRVELRQVGDRIQIVVEDGGRGFDPRAVDPNCFGLQGIRQRARMFGGQATIDSAPGQGTRIRVELPVVPVMPADAGAPPLG